MKLDDFLKTQKVRCVKAYDDCLKIGKEYDVIDISVEIKVKDDEGAFLYWESDHFEPVPNQAENPLQGIELTPEFETAETVLADNCEVNIQDIGTDILDTNADIKDTPKFEVGDPVYWGLKSRIFKVYRLMTTNVLEVELDGCVTAVHKDELCLATQENYEKLCGLFERIDFECPLLTGNELCRKLLDKGEKYIMAKDDTDTWRIICDYCDDWFTDVVSGKCLKNVTPVNSKGEPLTEAVLDE